MILSPRLFRQSRAVCFPPEAACHSSSDTSGSILLTNSAHSIDFFDSLSENSRQKQAHQHSRRLVKFLISRRSLMRDDGNCVAL
ncbi:MAG: hypothetical protein ACI8P0_001414 [Planctomycetaceae bacterium]|jgi:hypothetical protein